MESPLNVQLETYAGPLDLLLDLIRKQEIDIYDIPIARITAQYLDYIHRAQELDIDLGGEFILMAATLIHIKSKTLLPADPTLPPEEQVDPREELVQRLLEHEKFKQAAQMLQQKQLLEQAAWSNPALGQFLDESEEPGLAVTLYDLVATFQKILDRARAQPSLDIAAEEISVEEMMERIRDRLAETRGALDLGELFALYTTRRALVTLFLAVLEMCRLRAILLRQGEIFGDITLRKGPKFDALFEPGALAGALRALQETDQEEDKPGAPESHVEGTD